MLSATQESLCADIVCQYDYYVVYYRYDYTEYTTGMERDYLIEVYCSDRLPEVVDGEYIFTECTFYEVTFNKYVSKSEHESLTFVPDSASDLVYTNAAAGAPQLCYSISEFRTYDFAPLIVYAAVAILCIALVLKVLFGGGK